jgi:hypothetical protein
VPEWDGKVHQAMIMRHEFDNDWLLLALEDYEKDFNTKRKELLGKSLECSKDSMEVINETNRYAFGKILIRIKQIAATPNLGKIFIRLKCGPFIVETKRLKAPVNNKYKFN